MTTTTASSNRLRARHRSRGGFTLVEILITMGLGSVVMAALLSTFIFVARSTLSLVDYMEMNTQARVALEHFSRDARMAEEVLAFSTNELVLRLPTGSGGHSVTYRFDGASQNFTRQVADGNPEVLLTLVEAFEFRRYNLLQQPATNLLETKQVQIDLRAVRQDPARLRVTNHVLSARFILRNKPVAN
ncbi:MAG: prepilin-type N-terminal cleavage/methylation domain-containing protein [Puniceicoccaceae bacterium]|nr:MAG: prepilin-type N-terminal cleavage/methylation domain-containing protein [Puniceicoccaceae bacterium]